MITQSQIIKKWRGALHKDVTEQQGSHLHTNGFWYTEESGNFPSIEEETGKLALHSPVSNQETKIGKLIYVLIREAAGWCGW